MSDGDPGEVLDFDHKDWVYPENRPSAGEGDVEIGAGASESSHHGHGSGDDAAAVIDGKRDDHGDGGGSLSAEQASSLHEHSTRLRSLEEAKSIFTGLGGTLGRQLTNTVDSVIHNERKRFRSRMDGDAGVDRAMREAEAAEEAIAQRQRREFQMTAARTRETKEVEKELRAAKAKLAKTRKDTRAAEEIHEARCAMKSYDPAMLGQGKKKGGGAQCQKARLEALNRVRSCAVLSPEQQNDWQFFATAWDNAMVEAHGELWANLFAEILQGVLGELEGNANAFSEFMHNESMRVLGEVEVLRLPGEKPLLTN